MNIYISSFLISLIGLALSVIVVIRNTTKKARLANVIFDWKLYWKTDLWMQMAGTILTVSLFLMLLGPFLAKYPKFSDDTFAILVFFSAVGYFGSDVASRFFSVVNSRIDAAIDYKTTQSDAASGNLDAPTPAVKPENKN
jgi:hypothetical protein